ncbi:MAG TPA: indolepyruvate oxidoreductase subunit beta [Bacteroidota bacterium]|jgi:indolepyruvate ferredoxin oxidoreductase beta subunit|nr:indolepyruvate oxidoreductase subunit beta [Bacteroidota bacterium]
MKRDIILAGVGGQGILTIATIIGYAAVERGLHLKQAEVHGMSQRGGDVQSHLRLSEQPIYSDLIPEGKADIIISIEPMESLRYTSFLAPDGWLIANKKPFVNIPNYPSYEDVWATIEAFPRSILIDADQLAKQVATLRSMNIVILGAASPFLQMEPSELEHAIEAIFSRKGDAIVQQNLAAFRAGRSYAEEKNLVGH